MYDKIENMVLTSICRSNETDEPRPGMISITLHYIHVMQVELKLKYWMKQIVIYMTII